MNKNIQVAIIMGSESDYAVMRDAEVVLQSFSISHSVDVVSAHRTPDKMAEFAKSAKKQGVKVIIAGAGGSAHLPGMVAAFTTLPVIGVPIESKSLKGIDSLYSIVQMPPGVPVNTMAINGAKNAALSAVQILAVSDTVLSKKLDSYKAELVEAVKKMSDKINVAVGA